MQFIDNLATCEISQTLACAGTRAVAAVTQPGRSDIRRVKLSAFVVYAVGVAEHRRWVLLVGRSLELPRYFMESCDR